jgi:hypothetical protein
MGTQSVYFEVKNLIFKCFPFTYGSIRSYALPRFKGLMTFKFCGLVTIQQLSLPILPCAAAVMLQIISIDCLYSADTTTSN